MGELGNSHFSLELAVTLPDISLRSVGPSSIAIPTLASRDFVVPPARRRGAEKSIRAEGDSVALIRSDLVSLSCLSPHIFNPFKLPTMVRISPVFFTLFLASYAAAGKPIALPCARYKIFTIQMHSTFKLAATPSRRRTVPDGSPQDRPQSHRDKLGSGQD